MCLCLFAIGEHPEYPFILLANRDEFRNRAAEKAAFWKDQPSVLAGRDLQGLGTWLGVNKRGRIAFLTNYRHPEFFAKKGPTRGRLVSDFLVGESDARSYLKAIPDPSIYAGFNLVCGSADQLYYFASTRAEVEPINNGIHGLSNAFLNSAWTKVEDGKQKLRQAISSDSLGADQLFAILQDEVLADDSELPSTGVSFELERMLSAKFINALGYGTVCSTLVKIDRNGQCHFDEISYADNGNEADRVSFQFQISGQ